MTDEERKRHALELFQQAYTKQMEGELEEAVASYRHSLDLYPTAEAYTFLGWSYSFMGRYDEAIRECLNAIDLDPDFGNPYNDIGAYLIELGRIDDAIPWLKQAVTAKRYESRCFAHFNIGRVYERKGQWLHAIDAYQQGLPADPSYQLADRAVGRLRGLLN